MKTRLLLSMSLLLSFFTVGCATVDVAKEKTFATARKDKASVYFYREKMFQGAALSHYVWENEQSPMKLGSLKNGSYFFVELPPGEHTFFMNGETRNAFKITLKAKQVYYFQVRIDMGFWAGQPKLTEVTETSALDMIKSSDLVMTTLDKSLAAPKAAAKAPGFK